MEFWEQWRFCPTRALPRQKRRVRQKIQARLHTT